MTPPQRHRGGTDPLSYKPYLFHQYIQYSEKQDPTTYFSNPCKVPKVIHRLHTYGVRPFSCVVHAGGSVLSFAIFSGAEMRTLSVRSKAVQMDKSPPWEILSTNIANNRCQPRKHRKGKVNPSGYPVMRCQGNTKESLYGYHKIPTSTTLRTPPPRMVQVEELDVVQRVQLATCAKVKLWRKEIKYFVGNMTISTARVEGTFTRY